MAILSSQRVSIVIKNTIVNHYQLLLTVIEHN
jgi:hypothetical protein